MASIISAGTTSATALNMSADTTGILQLASNNGTVALTISTAQNVGIGTTSPNQKFRVEQNYNGSTWMNAANSSAGNGAGSGVLFTTDQGDAGAVFQNSSGNGTANALRLRNLLNAPILFETNGSERARFSSAGEFLVNTTAVLSTEIMSVRKDISDFVMSVVNEYGSTSQTIRSKMASGANNSSSYHFVGTSGTLGQDKIYIYGNGNIVNVNNSYGTLSDVKLKENIVDATPKLSDVMRLQVRNFNLKSNPDQKQIGFVAQELEQVFPAMIEESPDLDAENKTLETTTRLS